MEKIGNVINIAANAVMMNVMFLIACLPIVTIGAAWNALFSAVRYNIKGEKWFDGFKVGYKTRFWRSCLGWLLLMIPIGIFAYIDIANPLWQTGDVMAALSSLSIDGIVRLVFASLIVLMLTGFVGALMLLNVYIPTKIGDWINNGAKMFFKVPLQLALVGLLMWFPLVFALLMPDWFVYFSMVFVVAYYMLVGMGVTILMKDALLEFLVEARKEGILIDERSEERFSEDDAQ